MTRPGEPADPDPETEGGGGTTWDTLPRADDLPPGTARCSETASCGAGAMTELCPISSWPSGRAELSTLGGGAITDGSGA